MQPINHHKNLLFKIKKKRKSDSKLVVANTELAKMKKKKIRQLVSC
jgi:hypothetical protein